MNAKRTLLLATAAAVCAVGFSPLPAQAAPPDPCGQRVFEQPFTAFGDQGFYTLLPGGAFEDAGAPGWLLLGGAAVVAGNEPFFVHSALDGSSLSLPAGSFAVSPPTCVGVFDQTFRLMAVNTGDPASALNVGAVYRSPSGLIKTVWVGRFLSDGSWQPSPIFRFNVGAFGASTSGITGNFVFAPDGSGAWRIDDVYLDPTKHR
jgi:hypothetical protein